MTPALAPLRIVGPTGPVDDTGVDLNHAVFVTFLVSWSVRR